MERKSLGCGTAHQLLPRSPTSKIHGLSWKPLSHAPPGVQRSSTTSPRVWRGCHWGGSLAIDIARVTVTPPITGGQHTHTQDGPFGLQPAQFNLSSARTDSTEMRSDIEGKILRLASPTVWNTMFPELCPDYLMQPHAAIEHICQVHVNRDGNQVVSMVQAYFQQLMGAALPFSSNREFPVSLCACFQDGLDTCLQTRYHRYFPQHSIVQLLNAAHQQKTLQAMLQAAQQAKDNLLTVQRVAREALGMSQAFHAGTVLGGTPPTAGVYPSQAEKTLTRYSLDGGSAAASSSGPCGNRGGQRTWTCFGCGKPHAYLEYRGDQGHVIVCPNSDDSGVRENATKNIEKMTRNRKKCHVQNLKQKNLGTANSSDFDKEGAASHHQAGPPGRGWKMQHQ
jgi:hypothetical protein